MSYVSSDGLGPFAVSITDLTTNTERQFSVDTSFEPYRREAFRHRTIPSQRQSINMTNISGEGTVNTEGLWRREQTEWTMGAGQAYLDRKQESQETRFYSSKGIDIFSYPMQAKLLPDTYCVDGGFSSQMVPCGGYIVAVGVSFSSLPSIKVLQPVTVGTAWTTIETLTSSAFNTTTYGGTTPATIYDIASNNEYVFIATDTGIWFGKITGTGDTFTLFAGPDLTTGYTGGYSMVRWANDQLIAAKGNRLYAFYPRTNGGTSNSTYGSPPSTGKATANISSGFSNVLATFVTVTTSVPHNLVVGQPVSFSNTSACANITSLAANGTINGNTSNNYWAATLNYTTGPYKVGDQISVTINYGSGSSGGYTVTSNVSDTVTVAGVSNSGSTTVITFQSNAITTTTGFLFGTATGNEIGAFNDVFSVLAVPSTTTFTFVPKFTVPSFYTVFNGGVIGNPNPPDVLWDNPNSKWVWSDAVGGETQVYLSGYVSDTTKHSGCIYRSGLLGSSTTSATSVGTTSSSSVFQPFTLNIPLQALPMSPDEYPTCLFSYLNFIFIGTNRGIRMAQTLSVYDPTATATGDLKSGPLIPNVLQPVKQPVTAIIGDGRFVWFSWNQYDSTSTGLGRLDLQNFIAGDPMAPVYASDVMVTSTSNISSLVWDPINNIPVMVIPGTGAWAPYAQNFGGVLTAKKYVASGSITSSIFDYGIPESKIPVFFDYGAWVAHGSVAASVIVDPSSPYTSTISVTTYTGASGDSGEYSLTSSGFIKAKEFQTVVTLNAGTTSTTNDYSPSLRRWTLKSWPSVVSGTDISVVFQLFSVNVVDGMEVYVDPYSDFYWLENLRQNQSFVTYTEGPLSVTGVIIGLDWIPHKRRGMFQNGFEGDCVVNIKTLTPYTYSPASSL